MPLPLQFALKVVDSVMSRRWLWLWGGHLLTLIGGIGIFLPLLPTTPLWLLAVICYSKSSPKFEAWILSHPKYGEPIRMFIEKGVVSKSAKRASTTVMLISGTAVTIFGSAPLWAVLCMWATMGYGMYFVLSRPSV